MANTLIISVSLLIAAVTFIILGTNNQHFMHDDAFITFRYAKNFADHGQIVWNLGERVEGYTNFLHMLLIAAFLKLGFAAEFAARFINFAALAGIAVVFLGPVRRMTGMIPAVSGLIVSLPTLPMVLWSLGMLEAPLVAFFVAGAASFTLLSLNREGQDGSGTAVIAGIFTALAVLTRPDSVLLAATSGTALLFGTGDIRSGFRKAVLFSLAVAIPVISHTAWRYGYYGDFLPNTFYTKVSGITQSQGEEVFLGGIWYVKLFAFHAPFPALLVALSCGFALIKRHRVSSVLYLTGIVTLYTLYILRVNGDHMPISRLFVPIIPVIGLLVALAIEAIRPEILRRFLPVAASLLVASQLLTAYGQIKFKMDTAAFGGFIQGHYIAENWEKGSTVALSTAGSIPYSNLDKNFIDMLGLNDKTIARREIDTYRAFGQSFPGHAKGDGAYILDRRPDYIIMVPSLAFEIDEYWFLSDVELNESPLFHECYKHNLVYINIPEYLEHRGVLPGMEGVKDIPFHYHELKQTPECQK
ncbi:ArnT family glycosyltransferase [Halovulum sp. GXIMD14793]